MALGLNFWRDDGARHPAAGPDSGHPGHRQQFHRPVQGHDAWSPSSACSIFSATVENAFKDTVWIGPTIAPTGYAFAALFYFVFCFAMSRYQAFDGAPAWPAAALTTDGEAYDGADDDSLADAASAAIAMIGVHKWYGAFHVLRNINLTVRRGERIVICGPSGSGKSTLIRCVNRLEEHQRGTIIGRRDRTDRAI